MNILQVVAEVYPLASVGGYSKVVYSLSKELTNQGHKVTVVCPNYSFIPNNIKKQIIYDKVFVSKRIGPIKYSQLTYNNIDFLLIDHADYYQDRSNVYGYTDDANRWAYLSTVALEFIQEGMIIPDVIHVHDWHTGILSNIKSQNYKQVSQKTILTIHNLKYQAMFDHRNSDYKGYDIGQKIPFYNSSKLQKLNFLKRGIRYSDKVVFVSKGYLSEVVSGINDEGLGKILNLNKKKTSGILNGIDQNFNSKQSSIFKNYDYLSIKHKIDNKVYIQKKFKLQVDSSLPLVCYVGRLVEQKGVDLLIQSLDVILRNSNCQFVELGGGDNNYLPRFKDLEKEFKGRVYIHGKTDFNLAPQIFAASDICLVPSRFEPCGLVSMEASRFGAIPIVFDTGGLKDQVIPFNPLTLKGTGFVFKKHTTEDMVFEVSKALTLFTNKNVWQMIIKNTMQNSKNFSWEQSAKEYIKIYNK